MDQAVQNESDVKVKTTKSDKKLKFKRIENENGNYFGINKNDSKILKEPINEGIIVSIKEKDKTLSTILTLGIPITFLGCLLAVLVLSDPFLSPL